MKYIKVKTLHKIKDIGKIHFWFKKFIIVQLKYFLLKKADILYLKYGYIRIQF